MRGRITLEIDADHEVNFAGIHRWIWRRELSHVFLGPEAGASGTTEKRNWMPSSHGKPTPVLVNLKAQRLQESLDFPAHLVEPPLVVGEDQEVIDLADVAQARAGRSHNDR